MIQPPLDTPDVLPLIFDHEQARVCLVALSERDYRAASFLDERVLVERAPGAWVDWARFRTWPRPAPRPCDFIFHIGHVGSTLLSRVLEEAPTVMALREPAVLRSLARLDLEGHSVDAECALFLDYLARPFRPEQRVLIKATSFVSDIGPSLMRHRPGANAILMFVAPQSYLAGIMAGEASREEARINAPMRVARLERRLGARAAWRLADMSEGEIIALGWACEALSLAAIANDFPDRVLWLDFEALLARPAYWLAACLYRLGRPYDQNAIAPVLASPEFGRYAKAREHGYDADLRRRLLDAARTTHAVEIERGLAWLNTAAAEHPALAGGVRALAAARRA